MKFGRRAFLQFTAGAVGGSLLTPIPWKLMDDSAIWSQNWSWRPSPERGPITKKSSVCVLCEGGCGIQVRLVNGTRVIYVEGNPKHPVNQGGICPLGAAGAQFLYAPYRVSQPMKQVSKRGNAKGFQPISWKDALAELGGRLSKLRSEGKAAAAACIASARCSSMSLMWQRFFDAYGSPNLFQMPSHGNSLQLAVQLTTGQKRDVGFALEKASYVLSFGSNLIEGWGSPGRMQTAFALWQQDLPERGRTRVVQVESRCSLTASKADRWVAVAPGSEPALALAVAHVMVKENLYDKDFVAASTFGFEDWTDGTGKSRQGFKNLLLSTYAPEQVAEKVGLDAGKIRDLAREFAGQKNAVAVWGSGAGDCAENIYSDLAFLALNVLKGNLRTGGLVSFVPRVPFEPLAEISSGPKGTPPLRLDLAKSAKVPLPGNGLHAFLDAVATGGPYPIDTLMIHEANPAYALQENGLFYAALEKIGFVVSFSSYLDETAVQADLILPNHGAFERYDDVIGMVGAPYAFYAVAAPVLKPRMDTKHTGDVVVELAKSLAGGMEAALPWKSYEDFLQARVKGLAASGKGVVADGKEVVPWKLEEGQPLSPNFKDGADLWKKLVGGLCWVDAPANSMQEIETDSGEYELACQSLLKKGFVEEDRKYLPHFAPEPPRGSEKDFPLFLVAHPTSNLADGFLPNPPFLNKTLFNTQLLGNDMFVQIHPQTARSLGFKQGDRAVLETPKGKASVRVHLSAAARAGVVYIARGLGHEAYDEYIRDKGVNSNQVVEVQLDPVTNLGTVWANRAQLHHQRG